MHGVLAPLIVHSFLAIKGKSKTGITHNNYTTVTIFKFAL